MQERADIFTQQIGNIPPREAVVARITIDQRLAWLPEGEWELRFPTVIGPRYIGSADTALDVRATHVKVTDKPLPVKVQIELVIEDNGVGLPAKDRDRLTEPYVTTREKGTGLGLAIVKRILEDHGGELELAEPLRARVDAPARLAHAVERAARTAPADVVPRRRVRRPVR